MYQFKIKKLNEGEYRFELGSIKMISGDYIIKEDKHIFTNPNKAMAFFSVDDNLFGVSNDLKTFDSAETFYDAMLRQYMSFFGKDMGTA